MAVVVDAGGTPALPNGFYWATDPDGDLTVVRITDGWVDYMGSPFEDTDDDFEDRGYAVLGPVAPYVAVAP